MAVPGLSRRVMTDPASAPAPPCPTCLKPAALCQCAEIRPAENRLYLLVLQHPQEQDRELGTARLALSHLAHGKLAIGLSWPNLAKALGRPAEPRRWAVLHLGSAHLSPDAPPLVLLDRAGEPVREPEPVLATLEGVVLLDGTWSQAKALWWRNPWLLKLHRLVLNPARPSRYGRLRREPRRESLSTLEAAAAVMERLEGRPELAQRMAASFDTLLRRYRMTAPERASRQARPA